MNRDWHACSLARFSRDAHFDGKLFIGVLASGVYCRPICPAPTAVFRVVRAVIKQTEGSVTILTLRRLSCRRIS
jgi:methylphosphotriester-DNA--protein-cysteine methyltransferase